MYLRSRSTSARFASPAGGLLGVIAMNGGTPKARQISSTWNPAAIIWASSLLSVSWCSFMPAPPSAFLAPLPVWREIQLWRRTSPLLLLHVAGHLEREVRARTVVHELRGLAVRRGRDASRVAQAYWVRDRLRLPLKPGLQCEACRPDRRLPCASRCRRHHPAGSGAMTWCRRPSTLRTSSMRSGWIG